MARDAYLENSMIYIISDDLTGACDTAVQFKKAGILTWVSLRGETAPKGFGALAFSTDSRALSPKEAREKVKKAVDPLPLGLFYKKIDSLCRGNPAAELDEVLNRSGADCAVVTPAFPAAGRTLAGGKLGLGGKEIDVFALFSAIPGRKAAPVGLGELRSGSAKDRIARLKKEGVSIFVFDAETEADLDAVLDCAGQDGGKTVFCGSAGLAGRLALRLGGGGAPAPPKPAGRCLVLLGTRNQTTRAQAEQLAKERAIGIVRLNNRAVLAGEAGAVETAAQAVSSLFSAGRPMAVLAVDALFSGFVPTLNEEAGAAAAERIAAALGGCALKIVDKTPFDCLICSGGDTALAVFAALGAAALIPGGELLPGMPYSTVVGGRAEGIQVFTKSGGFGGPNALVEAADALFGKQDDRPILGITMGDPCGIGPEVIARALERKECREICRPLVIGSAAAMQKAVEITGAKLVVHPVSNVSEAKFLPGIMDVLDQRSVDVSRLEYGAVSKTGGEAAFLAVEEAIRLALAGEIHGTVTAPLNKEALNLAGHPYSGHTEIYADLTNTRDYAMVLVHEHFRVIHVTTHVSLRKACDLCKKERVLKTIRLARAACVELGIESPRIAVAGLNPHAGENGLFGDEEISEIRPAVEAAQKEGINAEGPLPPDTVFSKAAGGMYDIAVAMYHDQGHIPMKLAGFKYDEKTGRWSSVSGVNLTVGLPVVRSSVDHGTAFDQAGKGTASAESMFNAIEYGALLSRGRMKNNTVVSR